jgi:fructose-1,6-bisphosphatase/inositol monophosphatase family enzyme
LPSDKKLSAIDRAGAHGFLAIAERVTATAGQLVRTRTPHTLTFKGDRDIRSDVDLDVEKLVRNLLHEQTPDAEFLGEEEGGGDPNRGDDRLYWILDPIDGTVNFVHGVPLCAISLSLVRAGQVLAAVIEPPFLNAQYSALLGHGSYVNSHKLQVSSTRQLNAALVSIDQFAFSEDAQHKNLVRHSIIKHWLRVFSASGCSVHRPSTSPGRPRVDLTHASCWGTNRGIQAQESSSPEKPEQEYST